MKYSTLERKKNSGFLDLSHLKRKNKAEQGMDVEVSFSDEQLEKLAKFIGPTNETKDRFKNKKISNGT